MNVRGCPTCKMWWLHAYTVCPMCSTALSNEHDMEIDTTTVKAIDMAKHVEPDLKGNDEARMIAALTDWWIEKARQEIEPVALKAVEYGPNSMIEVGRAMGRMSGRDLTDEEAIEVACMFYISGKLGRWVDAVAHGKRPTDDTIHDIGIYIKMTQRNRDVGGWPFAPGEEH